MRSLWKGVGQQGTGGLVVKSRLPRGRPGFDFWSVHFFFFLNMDFLIQCKENIGKRDIN